MKLIFVICLFLIFIINNNLIYAQLKIIDITNGGTTNYKKYPSGSDKQSCEFYFVVYAYTTTGALATIQIDQELPLLAGFNYDEEIKNASSIIATVNFNDVYGSNIINVRAYATGFVSQSITISYTCEEIDTSSLVFKVQPNNQILKPMFNLQFYSIISILGLKYPLANLITTNTTFYTIFTIDTDLYGVLLHSVNKTTTNIEDLTINISFPTKDIVLRLPSVNRYSQNSNFNVVKYPPSTQTMIESGLNYSPLYTVRSNSGNFIPIYEILNGNVSLTFQADPVAIYGTIGDYTYIGNYYHIFGSTKMSIFTQNGNGLEFVSFLEWDITIKTTSTLPSTFSTASENTGSNVPSIITPRFNNPLSDYSPLVFKLSTDYYCDIGFPFGYEDVNSIGEYKFGTSFIKVNLTFATPMTFNVNPKFGGSGPEGSASTTTVLGPMPPVLVSFELIHLYNFNYLYKIKVNYDPLFPYTRIAHIKIDEKYYRYDKCTAQDVTTATFEIIVSLFNIFPKIEIMNRVGLKIDYDISDYYNLDSLSFIPRPSLLNYVDLFSIQSVSFLFNNLNVTNQSVANKIYFSLPSVDKDRPFALILLDKRSYNPGLTIDYDEFYYSKWNHDKQLFEIEFIVPANIQHGVVPWMLTPGNNALYLTNSYLPESSQLIVSHSNFDSYGPIFTQVNQLNVEYKVGWNFTIEDKHSGFKSGEITIRGEVDGSIYKFQITPTNLIQGDSFVGVYIIEIDLTDRCVAQRYLMTDIVLLDIWDNKGTFSTVSKIVVNPVENVFINFLNNPDIHIAIGNCPVKQTDTSPPTLVTFYFDYNISDNSIVFTFQIEDQESGIKAGQHPIVYATSNTLEIIQCPGLIAGSTSIKASYNCVLNLPVGFGYGGDIIFSIYGLINNAGLVSGYPTSTLISRALPYFIQNVGLFKQLKIEKASRITTNSGDLWVNGIGFDEVSSISINFGDGKPIFVQPALKYSTALLISNISPTNHSFDIMFITLNNQISNTFTVHPINFNYVIVPLPTNPPQQCLGNPECGGTTKGYCSTSGCICYSPWIGNDCTSKIVIVPQTVKNLTYPSTQIPIPTGNESGEPSTDDILFNSLILIYSLREFDFNMNVVNEYKFDKWIYKEIDSTTSEYQTNITVPSIDGILSPTTTNITATLQWYKDETNITFANEQLQMHPSTIKYTIGLSDYSFKTNLNTLQLIMSASFSTSLSNDICSIKEFGNTTTGDNSNYLKIQIQDHSLYGRFIKRAVMDNTFVSINNIPLDESLNSISSASISQSYIGINLPNYQQSIIIDPDFSILLNSNSASDNDNNSICSSSKSGLTTTQLIGIIVGSAIFFIALVGVALFILIKKRKHTLLLLKIKDIKLNKKL